MRTRLDEEMKEAQASDTFRKRLAEISPDDQEALGAFVEQEFAALFEFDSMGAISAPGPVTTGVVPCPIPKADGDVVAEVPANRWTYEGFRSFNAVNNARMLYRRLAMRTTDLSDVQDLDMMGAAMATHSAPQWSKLPGKDKRAPELDALITAVRVAVLANDGSSPLNSWVTEPLGDDVCCIAVDLEPAEAERFLGREAGEPGKYLRRVLAERLTSLLGSVSMAAVWVRPNEAPEAVRVYLVLRTQSEEMLDHKYQVDRERRFYGRLLEHAVPHTPDGMPLRISLEAEASYLGMTLDEHRQAFDPHLNEEARGPLDVEEYVPGSGFLTAEELEASRQRSCARWKREAMKAGVPYWMNAKVLQLIQDVLAYDDGDVKQRKQLTAKKEKWRSPPLPESQALRLDTLSFLHEPLRGLRLLRGSPAQLLAAIYGSGVVIGDYTQSEFKAGRAKTLYTQLRARAAIGAL